MELKPCPWCGEEPMIHNDYSSESGYWWIVDCLNKDCPVFYTKSVWDGVNATTGWRSTEEEALEAWNTRYERTTPADKLLCRHCGYSIVYQDGDDMYTWDYCPHCGARIVD